MKISRTALLVLIAAVSAYSFAQLAGQTNVRIGETKKVAKGVTVKLVDVVEDSRCPEGVDCVWAGNAKIRIRVNAGRRGKMLELNTGDAGDQAAEFAGYRFSLKGLTPQPKAEGPIDKKLYTATIETVRTGKR